MLATAAAPIDSEDFILFTLNELPYLFNSFKTTVRFRSNTITLYEIQELLLIEDSQISLLEKENGFVTSSAFSVTNNNSFDANTSKSYKGGYAGKPRG